MDAPDINELEQLQAAYRLLFERNPQALLVVAQMDLPLLYANEAAARCYGYTQNQLLEMRLSELFFPEDLPLLQGALEQGCAGAPITHHWRQVRSDGVTIEVAMDSQHLTMHGLPACLVMVRDESLVRSEERARAQLTEQLLEERERLQAIVQSSGDAIITTDITGLIQTFNPAAEQVFGVAQAQMLGKSVHGLLPQRFRDSHAQQQAHFSRTEGPPRMMGLRRVKGLHADGHEIDLEGSIAQVRVGQAKVLIATLRDVTSRAAADAERQATRTQLSDLARRLMSQEKELVKRIAQALHDQLGQTTAAIRIIHETMGMLRRGKVSREYARLDQQLGKLIDQATRQVRKVLIDLHPPLLDEQGLAAALDNELRSRALAHERMNFVLHAPPDVAEVRWPGAVEYAAFMVAREAIENALRHAGASLLTLSLYGSTESLSLDVVDDGIGIESGLDAKPGHLGITGMVERAKSIGATVVIGPGLSGGTRVCLRWSLTA